MIYLRTNSSSPFFIVGPTGVGKSSFSIELACQLDGEIIGADAFQLYQGLPLLTAQPSQKQQFVVPHHLIGVLSPTEACDAVRYRALALPVIDEIISRHHLPIVTGGTGFYLRALISSLDPLPPADPLLRAELAQKSHEELIAHLIRIDPAALPQIDSKNRRRVERVIEIITQTEEPLSQVWQKKKELSAKIPPPFGLFLLRDRDDLHRRIEANVHMMFDQGVVNEIANFDNIQMSSTASMALGLREIRAYCRGEQTLEETKNAIILATKRYAKRQITWFKNQHSFPYLNLSQFSSIEEAIPAALQLLQK
ncbi:MAG: tRNA (adenosine(37)-N6)-dimethylallyltransferase MiaA [Verrucomicrobia bacterium RIFCSPHIGHO2_12_FULL_41_10]|nr:MAG: tRNA (adenosine(37)-N6)-dimethylallyltransferase MiaA [Verrucomicrobia bacterium RIFCSPHIGHO2_12_FULL_41_10]HLB34719.1 tRNA (adenosine(37)-N6)-dimethylallyltransferase MiaA [Chthoniobacterales bacterium]